MNKLKQILKGKVVVFTGTYPGVGKSYCKEILAQQLKDKGYRVFNSGTTHKATSDKTVSAISYKYNKETNEWLLNKSVHPKTEGFYIIDEAFMMDEERLQELKSAYPNMCFILFGDPMQFLPASGKEPLHSIDVLFELNRIMRAKDKDLIEAIKMTKLGQIPFDFMLEHSDDKLIKKNDALVITYNKASSLNLNKLYTVRKNNIYRSERYAQLYNKDGTHSKIVTNSSLKNGDLWKLIEIDEKNERYILKKLSDDTVRSFDRYNFTTFFVNRQAVNNHKIQGDTIKSDTNIFVSLNDTSIWDYRQTLLRHIYVAISRAETSKQLFFKTEEVERLIEYFGVHSEASSADLAEPMYDFLKDFNKIETDSATLSNKDILDDLIIPNICPNGDNPSNIYKTRLSSFGQGQNSNEIGDQSLPSPLLSVFNDRGDTNIKRLKDYIEASLNNRQLQEIPGKGKNFITINDTIKGTNVKGSETEYNWFVFEIDEIDGKKVEPEQIYKLFIDRRCKYKDAKKYTYRIIFSGNKSYHFWIYIDNKELNEMHSRELYKAVHNYLNDKLFNGWADRSLSIPEHYVRAPGVIRPDTGKEQELILRTRKISHIDNITSLIATESDCGAKADAGCVVASSNDLVMQAFNMYKDDIPTTNGGRGSKIIAKLFKESRRGTLDKDGLSQLCKMLCEYANCPEKANRIIKDYLD